MWTNWEDKSGLFFFFFLRIGRKKVIKKKKVEKNWMMWLNKIVTTINATLQLIKVKKNVKIK